MRTPGLEVWLLAILGVATCLMRYFHDLRRYCQRRTSTWDPVIRRILERSTGEGIARSDLKDLSRMMRQAPAAIPRLTPTLFTFSVLSIVAVTLAVSLAPGAAGAIDMRTSVMTTLLATLATIGGFYFGGKAAEPAPALR